MPDGENYNLNRQNQLVVEFLSVLAEMDICFSGLRNAFLNGTDAADTAKTLARLKAEAYRIKAEINDRLDGEKN